MPGRGGLGPAASLLDPSQQLIDRVVKQAKQIVRFLAAADRVWQCHCWNCAARGAPVPAGAITMNRNASASKHIHRGTGAPAIDQTLYNFKLVRGVVPVKSQILVER